MNPQNTLPESVIDELEILASSSPFVNGDAVYTARAIVGYSDATISTKSFEPENEERVAANLVVRVFPNPAQSTLTVEVTGLSNELCKFVIMSTFGKKLLEKTIQTDVVSLDVDVSMLSNGIYFFEILNSTDIRLYSNRLVIIK